MSIYVFEYGIRFYLERVLRDKYFNNNYFRDLLKINMCLNCAIPVIKINIYIRTNKVVIELLTLAFGFTEFKQAHEQDQCYT